MKIVCAASVLAGEAAFNTLGDVAVVPEEEIRSAHLTDADVLITRSKARINESLLKGSAVRFVGCAVAGTDHIDADYLARAGIAWRHAPGCNANSVAEYVITALLNEAERHAIELDSCTLGIIGVGQIGSRVAALASSIGMTVLLNDPPREAIEGSRKMDFLALSDILPNADFITLHVPLNLSGPHKTAHLVDHRFLAELTPGTLLINTSRGETLDSEALLMALEHGPLRQCTLDVWENEPAIRTDVLDTIDFGTPHIAGYSWEGRLNGTLQVYEACCEFLHRDPVWDPETVFPAAPNEIVLPAHQMSPQSILTQLANIACPLIEDDQRLRASASQRPEDMARHFVHLRRNYAERREFGAYRVALQGADAKTVERTEACGFQVADI